MSRRHSALDGMAIALDRTSGLPIAQQIYRSISSKIVAGVLSAGSRLPSTRSLSLSLGVSRTTVADAFDLLHSDGYIEGHTGSGTYVSNAAGRQHEARPRPHADAASLDPINDASVSRAFESGLTLDYFPFDVWEGIAASQLSRIKEFSREGDPAGYEPLRQLLADLSWQRRGIRCSPSQIIITSGMTQGLDLVARTLLHSGDVALVENPCEQRVSSTLTLAGAHLLPVAVDGQGMAVEDVGDTPFRLAHLSAVRQYPTGAVLSAARESLLREKADRHGAYLIEMENTFLVPSPRRPMLASPDADHSRSIYLATFSWVIFRALRLGYVIAPQPVVDRLLVTRFATDFKPPLLEQVMLEQFVREGHFERYTDRLADILAMRQATMMAAWPDDLPPGVELAPEPGGLGHLLTLPDGHPVGTLVNRAAALGLSLRDLSSWHLHKGRPAVQLGFAQAGQATTVRGVETLAALLRA